MNNNVIKSIEVGYFKVPLEGNLVDALHGKHDHFEIITATVLMNDGTTGVGYTYTGGIGGTAITLMLKNDLVPRLVGRELTTPEQMNDYMSQSIHYVARGGIASFAISALDIAFWDVKLKRDRITSYNVCYTKLLRNFGMKSFDFGYYIFGKEIIYEKGFGSKSFKSK